MATPRLTMKNIREILRQKWVLQRTHRDIASSKTIGLGTITKITDSAKRAGLTWEVVQELSDEELEARVYGTLPTPSATKVMPDFAAIHVERRRPGVTLALLHIEYAEAHPDGYRYTQFCELYRQWVKQRGLTMRIDHVAGDKVFVDYSGKRLHIIDRTTGECLPVELFVGVLGASSYTYAEATMTQRGPDFIASHARMLEYFGGVSAAIVPDQLKSGVARSCWYDPKIQRTYEAMAEHYGTTVMPARPGKPRDKAKVEVAVQVVQRWILARLRQRSRQELETVLQQHAQELRTAQDGIVQAAQQAAQQTDTGLSRSLEHLPQGVVIIDADLNLVAWNSRYVQLFRYPADLMQVGRPIADLVVRAGVGQQPMPRNRGGVQRPAVPAPAELSTRTSPPWACTTFLTIARPRPRPRRSPGAAARGASHGRR